MPILFRRPPDCNLAPVLFLLLMLLTACFGIAPARAAATADQITREALLRGYTTQDAERRYKELQNRQVTASTPGAKAMASSLGAMAANMEKRMKESNDRFDRFYALMEAGLDVPMQIQSDLDTVQKMFADVVDSDDYNMAVRRRLVEYALHQRQLSSRVFPTRNPARAAQVLRLNAYDPDQFYPWSAHMLAKLYLTGNGVPRDEGEAFFLLSLCGNTPARFVDAVSWSIPADTLGCYLTLAQALRFGWGTAVNAGRADTIEAQVAKDYRAMTGKQLTINELREILR